ncbi:MAG: hypothetical protein ACR2L4_04870 [Actinomycetota bacterium]|nr:hypothetical protein [Actinomycetota bacterium]
MRWAASPLRDELESVNEESLAVGLLAIAEEKLTGIMGENVARLLGFD